MEFFKFIFKTQLRPILDYGSPIWAPIRIGQIDSLETVLNSFLRKIPALRCMHMWDRLKVMNITSLQRRMEGFTIIYAHKILSGVVPNPGGFNSKWTHRGRFIEIPPFPKKCPPFAKKVREQTFTHRAARLFNSCPAFVRNYEGSTLGFKNILTSYIKKVPDKQRSQHTGIMPAATDQVAHIKSNSLVHWRTFLEKHSPNYQWH